MSARSPLLNHSNCPCCGSPSQHLVDRAWVVRTIDEPLVHNYGFCPSCEHLFVTNPPTAEFLRDYYGRVSQTLRTAGGNDPIETAVFAKQARFLSTDFQGMKVLEIGADTGQFLDYLQERGAVTFFDEHSEAARNIIIKRGFHEEWRVGQNPVDAIVIRHTLEHIPEPRDWLSELGALKPTGVLFIEVPDWTHLEVDTDPLNFEHLHQFTAGSLSVLLGHAGYAVEAIEYDSTPGYHTTPNRVLRVRAHKLDWSEERSDRIRRVVEDRDSALAQSFARIVSGPNARRVAVYAASWYAQSLCTEGVMNKDNTIAVFDGDPAKQGNEFFGFMVRPPEEITAVAPDTIVLLSSYEEEIRRFLQDELGFEGTLVGVSELLRRHSLRPCP